MASAPVEGFELDGAAAVVFVELGGESDVEGADWEGFIAGAPPKGFVGGDAVGEPHFDVLFIVADALEWALVNEVARAELDGGVALAHRFEAAEMSESGEADFVETDFGIDAQRGFEFLVLKALARDFVEVGTESVKFIRSEADSGGHGVTAVAHEQVIALAQSGREVKTGDAASGTAPLRAVASYDDGRAIKLLEYA